MPSENKNAHVEYSAVDSARAEINDCFRLIGELRASQELELADSGAQIEQLTEKLISLQETVQRVQGESASPVDERIRRPIRKINVELMELNGEIAVALAERKAQEERGERAQANHDKYNEEMGRLNIRLQKLIEAEQAWDAMINEMSLGGAKRPNILDPKLLDDLTCIAKVD